MISSSEDDFFVCFDFLFLFTLRVFYAHYMKNSKTITVDVVGAK